MISFCSRSLFFLYPAVLRFVIQPHPPKATILSKLHALRRGLYLASRFGAACAVGGAGKQTGLYLMCAYSLLKEVAAMSAQLGSAFPGSLNLPLVVFVA